MFIRHSRTHSKTTPPYFPPMSQSPVMSLAYPIPSRGAAVWYRYHHLQELLCGEGWIIQHQVFQTCLPLQKPRHKFHSFLNAALFTCDPSIMQLNDGVAGIQNKNLNELS